MKIANRLTGGLTGGAAHAAIASSALFGTLSGAAISNVVSTGVMTIPVIRRSGFKPAFAGAVEAAASSGGQIMPPVMGVVAFFVAGQIGLEYRYIVVAAIMPAIFYYLGTFLAVYFEARKLGIGALPASARPKLTGQEWVQCLVFVMPLGGRDVRTVVKALAFNRRFLRGLLGKRLALKFTRDLRFLADKTFDRAA